MKYKDLRDFIAQLESMGELKRVTLEIDPRLEMTEYCDRVLKREGPAILFENPKGHRMPVLGNLFGTVRPSLPSAPCSSPASAPATSPRRRGTFTSG